MNHELQYTDNDYLHLIFKTEMKFNFEEEEEEEEGAEINEEDAEEEMN